MPRALGLVKILGFLGAKIFDEIKLCAAKKRKKIKSQPASNCVSEIIVARNLARRTRPTTGGFMNAFFAISLIGSIDSESGENCVFVNGKLRHVHYRKADVIRSNKITLPVIYRSACVL